MAEPDSRFRDFPRVATEILAQEATAAHLEITKDTLLEVHAVLSGLIGASRRRLSRDLQTFARVQEFGVPTAPPSQVISWSRIPTSLAFARLVIQNTRDEERTTVTIGDAYRALVEAGKRCGWWPIC